MKKIIVAFVAIVAASLMSLPALARVDIVVDKSAQQMTVKVNGVTKYRWAVSTGRGPYETPTGTWRPKRLEANWHSRRYNMAPMPHSIFYHRGYAIHGTTETGRLGQRASHGCTRLHPKNAATLFSLVRRHGMSNTRVTVRW